jgi:predicted PurR-regulated permease PerM
MQSRRVPGLVLLGGFALVTAILYFGKPVLMPIALAVLLAFLLNPLERRVERVLPRGLAVTLVVVLTFTALGFAGYVLGTQIAGLAHELPKYRDNIRERIETIRGASRGGALEHLKATAREVMEEIDKEKPGAAMPAPAPRVVVEQREPRSLLNLPAKIAPVVEVIVQGALVIALVGFMLLRRQDLRNRFIRLIGESRLTLATKAIDEASERISSYLLALSLVNAVFGVLIGVGLGLIGLPYALLWGVIAASFRFIPYVGVWMAALMPIVLALAVFDGWREPLLVAALFAVLEPLIFLVLEPLFYHHRVGVSDVALLAAVAFWTWLWGAVGLVLAVPLTVCAVVLGKYVPELRFIPVLLGDETDVDPPLAVYQRLLAGDVDDASELVERALDPHRPHAVYDEVLVPTLAYARREYVSGRISDEDKAVVVRGIREILDGIAPPSVPPGPDARRVVACAIRDELDELGFVMLRHLLDPAEWDLELASAEMLSSEVVAFVAEKMPGVVCLGAVGVGGFAHTRYLTKRLRSALPDTRIVVGRWGVPGLSAEERAALERAGANDVSLTLVETREYLRLTVTTGAVETRSAAA